MARRTFEEWYKDFLKYNQNGSVPVKFITPEGKKLGIWVNNVRSGGIRLTDDQKQMLNDVNFVWSAPQRKPRKFEEWYEDFLKYNQNGYVPFDFITPEGNKLGRWVNKVRSGHAKLTSEQKEKLSQAGFRWEKIRKPRKFEEWYEDFLKYNQNGYVPFDFITPEGNKLGQWVQSIRSGSIKLTCTQEQMLNDVNFVWLVHRKPRKFEEWYEDFLKYNQNGFVSVNFITPEGNILGHWVWSVRSGRTKLTSEQKEKLSQAGFRWEKIRKTRKFEEWYEDFLKYNQNGYVPFDFITPEGNKLGQWVQSIRSGGIKLTCAQEQMLNDANFAWTAKKGRKHRYS